MIVVRFEDDVYRVYNENIFTGRRVILYENSDVVKVAQYIVDLLNSSERVFIEVSGVFPVGKVFIADLISRLRE